MVAATEDFASGSPAVPIEHKRTQQESIHVTTPVGIGGVGWATRALSPCRLPRLPCGPGKHGRPKSDKGYSCDCRVVEKIRGNDATNTSRTEQRVSNGQPEEWADLLPLWELEELLRHYSNCCTKCCNLVSQRWSACNRRGASVEYSTEYGVWSPWIDEPGSKHAGSASSTRSERDRLKSQTEDVNR